MNRFAVAFLYQQDMPRFDRYLFDGEIHHYYQGEVEVLHYKQGLHVGFETRVGLQIVDAESGEEAALKVTTSSPFHIVGVTSQQI